MDPATIATGIIGVVISGIGVYIARQAMKSSEEIARTQRRLAQRQLIIPLWQYMASLNKIDTENPNVDHVLKAVNTLELVALCVEGNMVDGQVIRRTFRDSFVALVDQIDNCRTLPALNKDGKALLKENKAAMAFYEELKKELLARDKPKALKEKDEADE